MNVLFHGGIWLKKLMNYNIDYLAFIQGRNWRLKNRDDKLKKTEHPFESRVDKDLWISWNIGCNWAGFSFRFVDQGVLF